MLLIGNTILTFSSKYILLTKKQNQNNFNFHFLMLLGIVFCILFFIFPSEANAENALYSWGSSGRGVAEFDKPWGIAIDSKNNVYVVDNNNHRVQKFTNTGNFISSWGSEQLEFPNNIHISLNDIVYVTDVGNNQIHVFTSSDEPIASWGSTGKGLGSFLSLIGIALNSLGHVFVVDHVNDRIQVFKNTLDTQKPILTVPPNFEVETKVKEGTIVSFDVTASNDVGIISNTQCNPSSQSIFPIGSITVTCKAYDAIDNVGVASFEVLVQYNKPVDYTKEMAVTAVGLASTIGTVIAYKTGIVGSKSSVISKSASFSGSSSNSNPSYDLSSEISQESINESNNPNEHFEQIRAPSIEIAVSWGFEK